jgi:hypothetical protein
MRIHVGRDAFATQTWDSADGPTRFRKLVIDLEIRGVFKKSSPGVRRSLARSQASRRRALSRLQCRRADRWREILGAIAKLRDERLRGRQCGTGPHLGSGWSGSPGRSTCRPSIWFREISPRRSGSPAQVRQCPSALNKRISDQGISLEFSTASGAIGAGSAAAGSPVSAGGGVSPASRSARGCDLPDASFR